MKTYVVLLLLCLPFFSANAQDTVETWIDRGIALHDQGDYEGAIQIYQEALKEYPESMLIYYEIALSHLSLFHYEEAIRWSEKALQAKDKVENTSLVYSVMASAFDNWGKYEEAIRIFDRGIQEDPDNYLLYFNQGITYRKMGEEKEAMISFLQALTIFPLHPSSLFHSANLLAENGYPGLAFYNYCFFLLFEPDTDRSRSAWENLMNLNKGSSPVPSFTITDSNFRLQRNERMDRQVTSQAAGTPYPRMYHTLRGLEEHLNEWNHKEFPKIYQSFYIPFFHHLITSGHLESFCRKTSAVADPSSATWITKHEDKITDLHIWVNLFWQEFMD